jgi:CRISPR-associated protein Cas2
MTIIVADNTPPAVRGLLKRWFVEPRPNVFVGTVNHRIRQSVIAYVRRLAPDMGMLVIASDNSSQGFRVESFGETQRRPVIYCGLHLIAEQWDGQEESEESQCSD